MRKQVLAGFSILLFVFLSSALPANSHPLKQKSTTEPRASFEKLWVDYDVYGDDNKWGMRIHVRFTIYEMLNRDAYVAIYFQRNDGTERWLMDRNSSYSSTDGYVAVYKSIRPSYDPAYYEDLQIFMPYNELDLDAGEYKLTMDVKVIYSTGGVISKLTRYDFDYSKAGNSTTNNGNPVSNNPSATVTYKDMWVDYDVYDDNQKGLRIHLKFSISNMKNIDCYATVYFQDKDGKALTSDSYTYGNEVGDLYVTKLLTPGYDATDYNDLTLFIPYSEFKLTTGIKYDLKMDADLEYKDGSLIQHLKYYDFWLKK